MNVYSHYHDRVCHCSEIKKQLTCLQWFSNTMRQVSGSAVQGLEGAALRLDRLPGPRGFNLLSQLILDPVGGRSKVTRAQRGGREVPVKKKGQSKTESRKREEEKKKMMWGGDREREGRWVIKGRESVSEQREGGGERSAERAVAASQCMSRKSPLAASETV